jgi:flagellin-specific chaperone FliS
MDRKLQESNQHKTIDGIQEVMHRLVILRDAWQEMIHKAQKAEVPSPSPNFAAAA